MDRRVFRPTYQRRLEPRRVLTVTAVADAYLVDANATLETAPAGLPDGVLQNDSSNTTGLTVSAWDSTGLTGTLSATTAGGDFTYSPIGVAAFAALDDGESLQTTFHYTASDDQPSSAVGTVTITVNGVNDAPTASGVPATVTVAEDTASNFDLSSATFLDVDVEDLTVTLTAGAGTFTASDAGGVTVGGSGTGTLTLSGAAASINSFLDTASSIKYTGASNVNGTGADSVAVQVSDGTATTAAGTISVNITAVNDAPTVTGLPTNITTTEETAGNFDLSAATFADIDGDTLTVTLAADSGTFAASGNGSVTVGGSGTGTLTLAGSAGSINSYLNSQSRIQYTGALNVAGTGAASVTVNVSDGTVNPQLGTISVNVTNVNDAPTVSGLPATATATEEQASNFDLSSATFADVDGDSLTVTLAASTGTFGATSGGSVTVGGSGTGTLTLTGSAANINTYLDTASAIQYTGATNVSGTGAATVTVRANDGTVNPLLGTISVNITNVNDAPTVSGLPATRTVTEDLASNFDLSAATFADIDGDSLIVTLTATSGTFSASSGGSVTVGGSGTGTLTLSGTAANINTYLDSASAIQYTGASNLNGTGAATVTVNVNDGTVNPQLGSISVDITPANDAPTVTGLPATRTVTEDLASDFDLSAATFADVDGDSLTVTLAASSGTFNAASGGSVTVGGSGTGTLTLAGTAANINTYLDTASAIQYTGASNLNGTGVATVTVNVNDGTVNPQLGSISIDITATNDPPTAEAGANKATDEDTPLVINDVSVDDVDGNVTLTVTVSVDHGKLTLDSSGAGFGGLTVTNDGTSSVTVVGLRDDVNDALSGMTYTPDDNYNSSGGAPETLTITANDGVAATVSDTANIDVAAVNDPPTFPPPVSPTIPENSSTTITLSASDSDFIGSLTELVYSISGPDAAFFVLNGNQLQFLPQNFEAPADSNTDNVYEVTVTVRDGPLLDPLTTFVNQSLTVTVVDANDPATISAPGDYYLYEDGGFFLAGSLQVLDEDLNPAFQTDVLNIQLFVADSFGNPQGEFIGVDGVIAKNLGGGVVSLTGTLSQVNSALSSLGYAPPPDVNASNWSLRVVGDVAATVPVTIESVNDDPFFVDYDVQIISGQGGIPQVVVTLKASPGAPYEQTDVLTFTAAPIGFTVAQADQFFGQPNPFFGGGAAGFSANSLLSDVSGTPVQTVFSFTVLNFPGGRFQIEFIVDDGNYSVVEEGGDDVLASDSIVIDVTLPFVAVFTEVDQTQAAEPEPPPPLPVVAATLEQITQPASAEEQPSAAGYATVRPLNAFVELRVVLPSGEEVPKFVWDEEETVAYVLNHLKEILAELPDERYRLFLVHERGLIEQDSGSGSRQVFSNEREVVAQRLLLDVVIEHGRPIDPIDETLQEAIESQASGTFDEALPTR